MCSPSRVGALTPLLLLLALSACQRERRAIGPSPPESGPVAAVSELFPGGGQPPPPDPRSRKYEANAFQISQGGRLYRWFNCNGCHFNGGGGIGPALMDDQWIYGASIEQIYNSIAQGRPNGMPSWNGKIPPQQIWQIAAYVRSLSANVPASANSSRYDEMTSTPPRNQAKPEKPAGTRAGAAP